MQYVKPWAWRIQIRSALRCHPNCFPLSTILAPCSSLSSHSTVEVDLIYSWYNSEFGAWRVSKNIVIVKMITDIRLDFLLWIIISSYLFDLARRCIGRELNRLCWKNISSTKLLSTSGGKEANLLWLTRKDFSFLASCSNLKVQQRNMVYIQKNKKGFHSFFSFFWGGRVYLGGISTSWLWLALTFCRKKQSHSHSGSRLKWLLKDKKN